MKEKLTRIPRILSAILCAAVLCTAIPVPARAASKISVKTLKSYAADDHYDVPDDFVRALRDKTSISHSQFKEYAIEYQLPTEYVQLFFDDCFVYRSGKTYNYVPLDESLTHNNYDWDNLVYLDNNEVEYVRDGKRRAIKGIDVSKHQGHIDWERVYDDGVRFAFIRLGYRGYSSGKLMIDGYFEENVKGAIDAGVKVGVYFFSQAKTKKEAVSEANVVLKYIEDYDIDYPIVYDVEGAANSSYRTYGLSRKQITDNAIAFLDTIEDAGYRSMIYSYSRFFVEQADLSRLEGYDKWVANYYRVPFYPYDMQILQYTSKGRVDGIKGNVDMNLAFVSYD